MDEGLSRVTDAADTLAGVAPAEVVDKRRTQNSCVTHREALAIVGYRRFRALAGKVRYPARSVVAQRAPPKEAVVSIPCDLVIEARYIPVVIGWDRSPETVPDIVVSVALAQVVGMGKGLQLFHYNGIGAEALWIHRSQLIRRQTIIANRNRM